MIGLELETERDDIETPKTDKAAFVANFGGGAVVDADFARKIEQEEAKKSKKPELGKHRKFFFIRTQIRLSCEPNATREDAENTLNQIISENHGEVLRIDSVIEE